MLFMLTRYLINQIRKTTVGLKQNLGGYDVHLIFCIVYELAKQNCRQFKSTQLCGCLVSNFMVISYHAAHKAYKL